MASGASETPSGASSDEGDLGWGGREWDDGSRSYESSDSGDPEDPDLERLRADRPPHHEERDR